MKLSRRQQRTARKLVLPLLAIGLMTAMMYLDASNRPSSSSSGYHAATGGAAARVPHLRRR